MLSDALSIVSWRSRPRSFVALMSLYESNYLRLASLAGDLRRLPDARLSRVADDCDLRLSVTERSPYTTSFDLTYLFDAGPAPPTRTCGYASTTTRGWSRPRNGRRSTATRGSRRMRGMAERELDQRWARNTMLNKWLEYCIDRGHGFR